MYTIGLDIGGTKIQGLLVNGTRIMERVYLLHEKKSREAALEVMVSVVDTLVRAAKEQKIIGVGVGVPSSLDAKKNILLSPPNFPSLKGFPLRSILQKRLRLPVKLENDAKCFVLGAQVSGFRFQVSGNPVVVGLTLGTGLGGGIRIGKRIWEGAHAAAGEVGHMVIVPEGERCFCGQKGCLEMYASRKFLVREGKKQPKELERRAKAGDKKALRLHRELGRYLGLGIANVVNMVDPDIVVLGGGIAKAHRLFLPEARSIARRHIISPAAKRIPIVVAENIDEAGAMGATMLFERQKA